MKISCLKDLIAFFRSAFGARKKPVPQKTPRLLCMFERDGLNHVCVVKRTKQMDMHYSFSPCGLEVSEEPERARWLTPLDSSIDIDRFCPACAAKARDNLDKQSRYIRDNANKPLSASMEEW